MKTCLLLLLSVLAAFAVEDDLDLPSPNHYAGVIRDPANDDHQHAGWFGARLSAGGAFTARIWWQGFPYAVRGVWRADGTFETTVRKAGGGTFTVLLDAAVTPGKIIVRVTDGALTSGTDARPALYGASARSPWHPSFNGVSNHFPDLGFPPNTEASRASRVSARSVTFRGWAMARFTRWAPISWRAIPR